MFTFQILGYADYVFTSMFTFEIMLKVTGLYKDMCLQRIFLCAICQEKALTCSPPFHPTNKSKPFFLNQRMVFHGFFHNFLPLGACRSNFLIITSVWQLILSFFAYFQFVRRGKKFHNAWFFLPPFTVISKRKILNLLKEEHVNFITFSELYIHRGKIVHCYFLAKGLARYF